MLPAQEQLSIQQGLSQGMVYDLCQTSDGFLWVATKDGLNRYDGYNFKVYNHDPFNSFSLAENTVTALFEDSRGWLWIGLDSRGVDLFEPKTGKFRHFQLHPQTANSSFEIIQIAEAPDGSMYLIQNGNGLLHIPIPSAWQYSMPDTADLTELTEITYYPSSLFYSPNSIEMPFIKRLQIDASEKIWVYTTQEAFLLGQKGKQVVPADTSLHDTVADVWFQSSSELIHFKGNRKQSIDLSSEGTVARTFGKPAGDEGNWVAIGKKLWLVTQGDLPDFSNPDFVVDAEITSVIRDQNGCIWIGTHGYGIRKISPRTKLFNKGATGTSIWGVWRDLEGRYFCKVINEVYPYNPIDKTVGRQLAFPQGPERTLDMHIDQSGNYWMLGRNSEDNSNTILSFYDPEASEFRMYPFQPDTLFKVRLFARILETADGAIWSAGINCKLARFDPTQKTFKYYDYASVYGDEFPRINPFALVQDGGGNLWVGTQQGLVQCRVEGDSLSAKLFQASPYATQGINNNHISCLLPDPLHPKEILWIGTKGGGINRMHIPSGHVQHITRKHGLPDQVIYGILQGHDNELWCSTNRGLVRLQLQGARNETTQELKITTFTDIQGLQDNEFNTHAFYRAANGELLFGGVNGLNRFFPEQLSLDTSSAPVYLVGLRVNHQPVDFAHNNDLLSAPLESLGELYLRHSQNNLSFEFALLDFSNPEKNRYRHRLIGLDSDWIETGTDRFAHFTHLTPGRYALEVEGSNGEGDWQPIHKPIRIVIRPPWWFSELALAMYVLFLTWLGWQIYQFQFRRLQLRQQLEFEHRETTRIRELEKVKTAFFTNVTHEFRTPLTLILEPARRIRNEARSASVRTNARHIETNSLRLLTLVNQLLDLAKLESGSMTIDLRQGNLTETLRSEYETFLQLADQRNLKLSFVAPDHIPEFAFDQYKVSLIVNNLLSNSLKFTPEGGEVKVQVTYSDENIEIVVSDTGIGIPEDVLPQIFNRFYQADNTQTQREPGTGIGLTLSRELAELMGGSLTVQSQPGRGTSFYFRMPVDQETISGVSAKTPIVRPVPQEMVAVPETLPPFSADEAIVLLIEDSADLREFIKESISDHWQVVEASDGEEGIQKAREILPDLVISDVMMPKRDGYAVCEALKSDALTAHIPIILLTGKSAIESKLKGLRTGADDYLVKPFNTEELLVRAKNLIHSRRLLREQYSEQAALPLDPENTSNQHLSTPEQEFLQRLVHIINERLDDEHLSVEEIAQAMFISRVQLHRKLKAITNKNATEFVREYRLERAKTMLQNREGLVYEIAYRVGFRSEKYFSRAFKEKFGVSPSQIE